MRVLVLTGAGRGFCSGADTEMLIALAMGKPVPGAVAQESWHKNLEPIGWFGVEVSQLEKPTIAAIEGWCLAGGLELALWCDLRIASAGSQLGFPERRWGVPLIDGGTQRLPRIVGPGKAIELITTAAKIDADEAFRIGLVERLVSDEELEPAAHDLAATIAAQPPLAVRGAKRAVHAALDGRSVRDGLVVEAEGQSVCMGSDDFREAITAFVEGRPPLYQGR